MASDLDNLMTRRSNVLAELAGMTSASNGGKPTYTIDGQNVQHAEYRKSLYEELGMLNQQISTIGGPFESLGQATT